MSDPRINLPVNKLEDEIERLQTRNERLALLVRLIDMDIEVDTEEFLGVKLDEIKRDSQGIPNLTDGQWERLFKLERGEA